jgi:tetraacyldisaccharide 4'-kinase
LVNGGAADPYGAQALRFDLQMDEALALRDEVRRPLSAFVGQPVDAMAGIGHPARFFAQLTAQGLMVHPHAFADHHAYTAADLDFTGGRPLLMTEKDAVKCRALSLSPDLDAWVVPVRAVFAGNGTVRMRECLRALFNPP